MAWSNLPSTHTIKTNWDCDTLTGGWADAYNGGSLMSLVDNQAGPESPPSALQGRYPLGHLGGNGVGNFYYNYNPGTREMYVGMWVKHESPFDQHPDGDKVCYYVAVGGNEHPAYSLLRGSRMDLVAQADTSVDNRHISGVAFTGTCILTGSVSNWTLGTWNQFEVLLRESTTRTSRDGIFRWWVNGVQVGNYTNVNTRQFGGYTGVAVNPVYGGGTQVSKTQEDFIWYDHIIISGGLSSSGGEEPPPVTGGLLQGARTTPAPNTTFNLTSEGVSDWVHWGASGYPSVNSKVSASSISRTPTSIHGGAITYYNAYPCFYTWSNGTPTATQSGTKSGYNILGPNQGLRITVPADTTQRTLKVWGNAFQCAARVTAALSDNSAPSYVDTSTQSNTDQWTFVYRAASANQSLTFTIEVLSVTASNGNVSLQAAALTQDGVSTPAPTITSFTPANGLVGSSVVITGTNFSALTSANTVKFNGTTATVTSASTTSLTVTVPTGATTGSITVTTAGGTATSGSSYTVDTIPVPPAPPEAGIGGSAMMILFMP